MADAKTRVTKTSLRSIGWKQQYLENLENLENLVRTTHFLTTHTYQLSRWILFHELERGHDFNPCELIGQAFFY
ncbi:hypothetical protein BX666DRAFT_1922941, partial [Dichotomocladium elegans]